MKRLLPVLMVLLMTGCAPWVKTEGPFVSADLQFRVDPPHGWMRRNLDRFFLITADGVTLQTVVISRLNVSDEKQFTYTKKRVTAGMLPHEVAEVLIDDFQADADNPVDAVEENTPAEVGGRPGCMIRLAYTRKDGVKYRCEIYACLAGNWLYRVVYLAPARYYFDKDLPAVQNMVKTFYVHPM